MMPTDAPFTAQVVAGVADSDPPSYILQLLASGVGNGDNGDYDLLPIGANLPDAHQPPLVSSPWPSRGRSWAGLHRDSGQDD